MSIQWVREEGWVTREETLLTLLRQLYGSPDFNKQIKQISA